MHAPLSAQATNYYVLFILVVPNSRGTPYTAHFCLMFWDVYMYYDKEKANIVRFPYRKIVP